MKPQYQHDCDACKFIGIVDGFDIYTCVERSALNGTAIARFGDDGADYASALIAYLDGYQHECSPYTEAFRKAGIGVYAEKCECEEHSKYDERHRFHKRGIGSCRHAGENDKKFGAETADFDTYNKGSSRAHGNAFLSNQDGNR